MDQNYRIAEATSDEIMPIVEKISHAIDGQTIANASMALLYSIFVISYPEISNKDLVEGIKEASANICMLLDTYENGKPLDKSKVN